MSLEHTLALIPAYLLVFFRLAGMMIFAPLFGSARIPRRLKILMVAMMALGMCSGVKAPVEFPQTYWGLAMGIGGEMMFGLAMGMVMSFVFIAAQWAGELMGQQMGLNLSEVFDPQFGQQGSLVGDMYFMLMLVVFLLVRGHHAMLRGIYESFEALPLMSVGVDGALLGTLVSLFSAATMLAIQLAAPMLVTMLIVDLALGFIGKTVPQINVMTAGLTLRSAVGMMVLIVALVLSSNVMTDAIVDSMESVRMGWSGGSR